MISKKNIENEESGNKPFKFGKKREEKNNPGGKFDEQSNGWTWEKSQHNNVNVITYELELNYDYKKKIQ